ncbi:MAG TPA: uroporphyrinogen decarboxylase family protein, partial [Clostridia bacterium]|nr:uroporphyrinogen decarboxylase family protein [Clostridia bacterium]
IDGAEYILPPMLNPKLFPYYATGDYKALVDLVRDAGKWSMIHSHGRCGMVLDEFRKIGMDSIHPLEPPPMGDVTLPQAREALGPDCIFVGNIQYSDLFHGCTEEDIEQKTLEIIAESKKGPIILAISASPIVQDLPTHAMRNYMRIIETVQRYGWYA